VNISIKCEKDIQRDSDDGDKRRKKKKKKYSMNEWCYNSNPFTIS
jgi:hypothetical protein